MGDLVLAIPAIAKLRARYPYARIDALVGSWNEEAAKQLAVFDEVFIFDFFSKKSAAAAAVPEAALIELIKRLPRYDIAIDLRRQSDTRFILSRISAQLRVAYSTGCPEQDAGIEICLDAVPDVPFETTELNRTPIALQMLRLVDALPSEINDFIRIPQSVSRNNEKKGWIAIFPNAGNDVKEWGVKNYIDLIDLLEADQRVSHITVFTASEQEAQPYLLRVRSKVGVRHGLAYSQLLSALTEHEVCVANNSFGAHLASWLGLRVVGIYGGHETVAEWGPVFGDCRIVHVPVSCSPCHIPNRAACKNDFKCLNLISPLRIQNTIFHDRDSGAVFNVQEELLDRIAPTASRFDPKDLRWLADCIGRSIPERIEKYLYVDVSELVVRDSRTGIQRVVRSILKCLLEESGDGFRVFPVYATADQSGYKVANSFLHQFNEAENKPASQDIPIEYQAGDVFLGLDFQPVVVPAQADYLKTMRDHGVRVLFVVYDILCVRMPQYFDTGLVEAFRRWLAVVCDNDGAICISRAVRDDLRNWMIENSIQRDRPIDLRWFHLGADMENSKPSTGFPEDASHVLNSMQERPSFIMVGTLEPRKGHGVTLDAFDQLWKFGENICLVIVGKKGWNVDTLVDRIGAHPELGKRLFWLDGVSDEYLHAIYTNADCLIAASEGEGFGLPLIEAAQHDLQIIARDIPVFREVAGLGASFFKTTGALDGLMQAISIWLVEYRSCKYSNPERVKWMTWRESADLLISNLSPYVGDAIRWKQ